MDAEEIRRNHQGVPPTNRNVITVNNTNTAPGTTTGTAPVTEMAPNNATHSGAKGIKGVLAAVHGAGETLRGTVNSAVDETTGSAAGKAKNDAITAEGIDEMETGQFGVQTKNREGAFAGSDHGKRY